MGKLIIVAAPSGAGKTTLCQKLLADFPVLALSISFTTRAPRGFEQNGREYHFVSRAEFEAKIHAGRFAEWALVHGNYYGTSKDTIEENFRAGKSVLLDIDVQGAESLAKAYPRRTHRIFIAPPDMAALEARLRNRGTDSEESIQKRLRNARQEIEASRHFDRIIVNDAFDRAYEELKGLTELYLSQEKHG